MRKIRFRAWHKPIKKMALPDYIDPCDGRCLNWSTSSSELKEHYGEYVLMQFTGLYDLNEHPIYEGDLVKFIDPCEPHDEIIRPVVWCESDAMFELQNPDGDGWVMDIGAMEVVGNIYEDNRVDTES